MKASKKKSSSVKAAAVKKNKIASSRPKNKAKANGRSRGRPKTLQTAEAKRVLSSREDARIFLERGSLEISNILNESLVSEKGKVFPTLASLAEALEVAGVSLPFKGVMPESLPMARHMEPPSAFIDMLGGEIKRSSAERFSQAVSERVNPSLLTISNKQYTALWTNRVAMWRFFQHFIEPLVASHYAELELMLTYHGMTLSRYGMKINKKTLVNPFAGFEHAFLPVMNAWMPIIKKIVRIFERNTRGGSNLREDFMSVSYIAFMHALEKQAMAIIGNPKQVQALPFHKRLEFAVRKSIYAEIPDLTGPVRVPVESPARKNMPKEVSLDYWKDDQ